MEIISRSKNIYCTCIFSNELWKIVEKKKKLESLSRNRNLLEREKLMMELQDSNETIRERNKKIHVRHVHVHVVEGYTCKTCTCSRGIYMCR